MAKGDVTTFVALPHVEDLHGRRVRTPLFLNVFNTVQTFMKENNLSTVAGAEKKRSDNQ